MSIKTVKVKMWGSTIGYLHEQDNGRIGFQYDEDFCSSGIEVSPITMPLTRTTYSFPSLSEETYKGLPGMLADSLPDKFGNMVINSYLESQGREKDSLTVIEKLCYTGKRGMGALEYEPAKDVVDLSEKLDLDALTKLASEILSQKERVQLQYDDAMISQLMQSSSPVGGARAKTLIAWNRETNEIRSGQIHAGPGFEYWLLKFDDIENNKDKDETPDGKEYTKIEYAYYLMAKAAGIEMSECCLFQEKGRSHFMTKRFDRKGLTGEKIHMLSLCAMAHMDFNSPRIYSYEDAFGVMKQLNLSNHDFVQMFKRMVFNDCAKNFDDHTKNIAFLMNKQGEWSLAPAYDLTFSYKKDSLWVKSHQMLINGKAEGITMEDFYKVAKKAGIKKSTAAKSIGQVMEAVERWSEFAEEAGVSKINARRIQRLLPTQKSV